MPLICFELWIATSQVEWLFTRSLVRHRQARDPSLWCPVPRVKVLQVEKVENRTWKNRPVYSVYFVQLVQSCDHVDLVRRSIYLVTSP